jgi:hypothetical protein
MGDDEELEVTREGLLDLVAGKAKEAAGSLVGNDDLALGFLLQQPRVGSASKPAKDAEPSEPAGPDETTE